MAPSTQPTSTARAAVGLDDLDLVVLCGTLSSDPGVRDLPSGDRLHTFEVTVREADERASSVPVVLVGDVAPSVTAGQRVAVVGRVRRRFFRAGGATASRTEVVADEVVAVRRRRDTRRVVRAATRRLEAAAGPGGGW